MWTSQEKKQYDRRTTVLHFLFCLVGNTRYEYYFDTNKSFYSGRPVFHHINKYQRVKVYVKVLCHPVNVNPLS